MLAKEVLRNSMDLNRRIKEQSVIYQDWKAMAMEIDEDEIHEIVEAAWDDLIASIRLKRELEELIMANHNADQREILRLRYLYAATWDAIADELNDSVAWVKEQYQKALKKLSAETEDMDVLLDKVNAKVKALGGYVESSSISNGTADYLDHTNRSASLTIRIPADQLDGLLNDMQNISNIVQQSRNVQDVTLDYVDTESHQKALKAEEKRLMEIMEQASSVEDIIAVEQQLTEVRYQLGSIESQLRVYDNQIDYSTVYLDISEVTAYTEPEPENIPDRIITGFKSNLKAVGYGLINLGIWIIIHIPQLLIFAVVLLILLLFSRRLFRKRAGFAGKEKRWKKKDKALKSENASEAGNDDKENNAQMQQEAPEKKE